MIGTNIVDGSGSNNKAIVDEGALRVSQTGYPPLVEQKTKIFRQYLTDDGTATGSTSMRVGASVTGTDGACADHTSPYTFTSASGGLLGAKKISITDTGVGGKGIVGIYTVSAVTNTNTVLLTEDPTDGINDETGLDYSVVSPIDFWIPADEDNDRYITYINFVIADESSVIDEFGHISALTTGCELYYSNNKEKITIHDSLQTNWDFLRMGMSNPLYTNIVVVKDVEGKVDAFTPVLRFTDLMPPYGLKLDAGSTQKLVLEINDNTIGVESFNCVAYGFDRFE